MTYQKRLSAARGIYEQGLLNVKNNPEPEGQKFSVGSRVYIQENLGESMSHFRSGCKATVEYVYSHAYPQNGMDIKSYSLNIDGYGSSAWYEEHQLTKIVEN